MRLYRSAPKDRISRLFSLRTYNHQEQSTPTINAAGKPALEYLARHNGWLVGFSIVIFIVLWNLIVNWGDLPAFLLPTPLAVWKKLVTMIANGLLFKNAWVTLYEVLLGLALGSVLATTIGYVLAKSPLMEKMFSPYLIASQAIPTVAIAPLLVIWFGPEAFSKILVCAMTVFFPILVNTMIGFRAVPENLGDLMRSMRATRWQKLRYLEIPAALPVLFGGLRIGATLSVIGAVVGEFVGSDQGLGYLINVGRGQYDTPLVFVSIISLIFMAICLYGLAMFAERRTTRWKTVHKD